MHYHQKTMKTAAAQTIARMISLAEDRTGGRVWASLEKAITEIKENKTIEFDGEKLTFVSRASGEQRVVTRAGCVRTACPCGNGISYHLAMFAILDAYNRIVETVEVAEKQMIQEDFDNSPYFPVQLYKPAKREKIGGVWI